MKIYRAGRQPNLRSITLFHAMARLGYEGLIITSPAETYVSVGYFDKTQDIVDLKKCRDIGIPIIRREVGGGAVLLDESQVFYQLIIKRRSEKLPFKIEEAYRKFSVPVIETYRRLGVETEYRPINDIVVKESKKKISGQGAADIGDAFVFVGGILLRFNTRLMSQLFRVPEEKFRDKLHKSLEENISWVERETGRLPSYEEVEEILIEEFSKFLDFEEESEIPPEAVSLADKLKEEFTSEEVLLEETGRKHRAIKIREGVFVRNSVHKARGGLLKAEIQIWEGVIEKVRIYGDFTLYPKSALRELEESLEGVPFEEEALKKKLEDFLKKEHVEFPGVGLEDLMSLLYES
ncbi:lipoate-protein ligase A [Hydrogenivirga caldilitoris]|uniref:lipoate--protein ligase n=1 Tax=Hydrogenivirga caldilitoris TaxID=246264 RepID=A0A497XW74_9AQUI|nr:lipoate protein ligase C-terminal domain-containing protein [Hydrogenivirga caldilitoris]RLJ71412.1 lipoate-protein ligase A [Hydrogenivirga caldilitoris]